MPSSPVATTLVPSRSASRGRSGGRSSGSNGSGSRGRKSRSTTLRTRAPEVKPTTSQPQKKEKKAADRPKGKALASSGCGGRAKASTKDVRGSTSPERDEARGTAVAEEAVDYTNRSETVSMLDVQQLKRAASFRFKYRLGGPDGGEKGRVNIHPHLVAWHKKNRRGMCPNPDRIQQLLLSYCGDWDAEEADHQSVCVQIKPGDNELVDWNMQFRENNNLFAKVETRPEVAAASHSHLNIVLHNIRSGAEVNLSGLNKFCKDGRLSMELIETHDKDMAAHAKRGLLWEVLAWQMEVEEPLAFDIIQAAFNSKNDTALVEHEMERLNGLVNVIRDTGAGMADTFNWRLVRENLMKTGNVAVAESTEFLALCKMIMNVLGGQAQYNHWEELKKWHELMVNPKTRRVRLTTMSYLSSVPPEFPRTRNALFRHMYTGKSPSAEQIKNGQIFISALSPLKHLEECEWRPMLEFVEQESVFIFPEQK